MTHFPEDSDDDDNVSFHPGFFERLRSRGKSNASRTDPSGLDMKNLPPIPTSSASSHCDPVSDKDFVYQDTAYKPHDAHIQFAELPPIHQTDGSLSPPKPPPAHGQAPVLFPKRLPPQPRRLRGQRVRQRAPAREQEQSEEQPRRGESISRDGRRAVRASQGRLPRAHAHPQRRQRRAEPSWVQRRMGHGRPDSGQSWRGESRSPADCGCASGRV